MSAISRLRWLPTLVTIALLALLYIQAAQLVLLAAFSAFFLLLAYPRVRAWYIRPPKPAARRFVAWTLGFNPPLTGPYYIRQSDHLMLKQYFENGSVYGLTVTDSPVLSEIHDRWGDMAFTRRLDLPSPSTGDTVLVFHVLTGELDPIPRADQLKMATIIPLFYTIA